MSRTLPLSLPGLVLSLAAALPGCGDSGGLHGAGDAGSELDGWTGRDRPSDTVASPGEDTVDGSAWSDGGDSEVPDGVSPSCPPMAVGAGQVRARVLACPEDLPEGLLASARVGDVVLENAVARFVVRAVDEGEALLGLPGGHLIDMVRVGDGVQVGTDPLRELAVGLDFFMVGPTAVTILEDGSSTEGTAAARVVVEGALRSFETIHQLLPLAEPAVTMHHEYVLRPDQPTLEVHTRLASTSGLAESHDLADLMFWGGETLRWIPGLRPGEVPQSAAGAMLLGEPEGPDTLPSAWAAGSSRDRTVLAFGPIFAFVYDTPQIGPDGVDIVRYVAVGRDTAAAARSVRDALGVGGVAVSGQVSQHWRGVSVEARDVGGAALVRCLPEDDGAFDCEVPVETTSLAAVWDAEGLDATEVALTPGLPTTLAAPNPATVTASVRDAAGEPLGFRLTAVPTGITDEGRATRRLVGAGGDGTFRLPAGSWDLWLTAGPTRERQLTSATLAPGETLPLTATLAEVVDHEGWYAADLHVHAELSPDSHVPMARRLAGAVAEGLDYVVMTDHDHVTDPAPWVAGSAVEGKVVVRTGVEVSTMRAGHFNLWPLEPGLGAGAGAPSWYGVAPLETVAALRTAAPGALLQCNHPRFRKGGYAALFDVVGLDPEHAEDVDPATVDCDLLEIVNGFAYQDVEPVVADWAALLGAGLVMAPTGTSDCHGTDDFIGHARTWVRAASGSAEDIEAALHAGRTVATAGPFMTLTVGEAAIGDTWATSEDAVTATVRVQAPGWATEGELRVLADGVVVHSEVLEGSDVTVDVGVDTSAAGLHWVAAYHVGGPPAPPTTHRPGNAVTAPVWILRD